MQKLNLPSYPFRIKSSEQISQIFDAVRKKYVALTPEEWVRQHIIRYLTEELHYPASLVAVEMNLTLNGLRKRCDIVAYDTNGFPLLIVECKAPSVRLTQKTFEQVARYNMVLKVRYLMISNGIETYCCEINFEEQTYRFMENLPTYKEVAV
jgi:hypothetical protein